MPSGNYELWVDDDKVSSFNDRIDAIDAARGMERTGSKNIIVWKVTGVKLGHPTRVEWREPQPGLTHSKTGWHPIFKRVGRNG